MCLRTLNKHCYPKAERLKKQLIYPSVTWKTKYSWLVYQQRVCKQQTSQRMYRSPAREELRELYISKFFRECLLYTHEGGGEQPIVSAFLSKWKPFQIISSTKMGIQSTKQLILLFNLRFLVVNKQLQKIGTDKEIFSALDI